MVVFQFPSNGKAYTKIRTGSLDSGKGWSRVSIPFKRESIYKGKKTRGFVFGSISVSIPFKRESIYKATPPGTTPQPITFLFQFPSNGKAYTKWGNKRSHTGQDSKFQFPSNGKAYTKKMKNSWQTEWTNWKFQFPSNGKAYTKCMGRRKRSDRRGVSIPFKRESIYKGMEQERLIRKPTRSFNSLQTGKHIQSLLGIEIWNLEYKGFNSLQTGKHIQSNALKQVATFGLVGFNSLQTGKHIQSAAAGGALLSALHVSIPFKRESIYKDISRPKSIRNYRNVSIPFKRESIYKVLSHFSLSHFSLSFQFPSNGKAYTKTL